MANEAVIEGIDGPATDQIPPAGSAAYKEWSLTGKLPEAGTEAPPSSPAPETVETPEEESPAAAESETAPKPERIETRRARTERRFNELLDDNRALRRELEEIRAKITAPAEKPAPAAEKSEVKAAAKTLADRLKEIDTDLERGKYQKYEDAINDKILAQQEFSKSELQAQEKAKSDQKVQDERLEAAKKIAEKWDASRELAASVHADFYDVVKPLEDPKVIPVGSVVEAWLLDSEIGTEVEYYLAQHRDELTEILKLNPLQQSRALTKLEIKLSPVSTQSAPAKEKPVPHPPPKILGSGAVAPADAIQQALERGDTATYIRLQNERDIANAKSRRG